ncbi:MAG: DISARM system phospholipase D-like protein DrmC [Bryobacteraceae bacterium]
MSPPLLDLSQADLRALASALRSGRLTGAFSILGLQRLLGSHASIGLAEWLTRMSNTGCGLESMAAWLEAFAEALHDRTPVEQAIQLVTTAPPGSAAVHRDTSVVVQDLFRRAQKSVLVSTYGIYGGREIFQSLAERMHANPGLAVNIFANIDTKPSNPGTANEIVSRFVQHFRQHHWPDLSRMPILYYDIRSIEQDPFESAVLHSKCIVIDGEETLVTSANFTEAAQRRNVEVGLLVKSQTVAGQILGFFDSSLKFRSLPSSCLAAITARGSNSQGD